MWLMVVFSDFSRRPARIPAVLRLAARGRSPQGHNHPGSAARGAPGCCLRVQGPEDEPGRRDAGPDEDDPVAPNDVPQGHGQISIAVLKPSIHEDGIPGVLLWSGGCRRIGLTPVWPKEAWWPVPNASEDGQGRGARHVTTHPVPRTADRSGPTEWRQADGIRGKPGSAAVKVVVAWNFTPPLVVGLCRQCRPAG